MLSTTEGGRRIGLKMLSLQNDKDMFECLKLILPTRVELYKRRRWLPAVEIEELKRNIEKIGDDDNMDFDEVAAEARPRKDL